MAEPRQTASGELKPSPEMRAVMGTGTTYVPTITIAGKAPATSRAERVPAGAAGEQKP